jgi:TetR/AcrR family transcriptional regulator, regulator of autoinduction and epiphytic fitness
LTQKTPTKRTYNSSRRKEQALQTRRQIIEAARNLFVERGYAGATIDVIAQNAGVAPETVYATFGSKRAILAKLFEVSLVGDDLPTPLLERQGPQEVMCETDQHRQVELFAADIYNIMSRVAPLFDVMRVAAKTEPEIAEMLEKILNTRVQGMMAFVRALMKNGPLRPGVTPEKAAETVWTLTSAEVFALLKTNRGWSEEKHKHWLVDSLTRLLLP